MNVNKDVSKGVSIDLIKLLIDFYVSTLSLSYYFDVNELTDYPTSNWNSGSGKNVNKEQWTQVWYQTSNIKQIMCY